MQRTVVLLALALLVTACSGSSPDDERQLRAAFEASRIALAERDYATAWTFMDSASRRTLAKQLTDFQNVKPMTPHHAAAEMALTHYELSVEAIQNMTTRDYFVAVFQGLDRTEPEIRKHQIEETRGRKITGLGIKGDRAKITTLTPSGVTEKFWWVRESSGWKVVATSVGEGFE